MPDRKFMAVMGSYGVQQIDFKIKNIHYCYNNPDIKQIYKRTRVLVMPSDYESYGRTAIEAAANGIPVVCTPTPGLKEALADSGIYCERDVSKWVQIIKDLDNEDKYLDQSKKFLDRAKKVNPEKELDNFLKFVEECIK